MIFTLPYPLIYYRSSNIRALRRSVFAGESQRLENNTDLYDIENMHNNNENKENGGNKKLVSKNGHKLTKRKPTKRLFPKMGTS
jgi:hypothetical protein